MRQSYEEEKEEALFNETQPADYLGDCAREYAQFGDAEQCWFLTDRDVWVRNPAFQGPTEPHPEDYSELN